MDKDLIRYFKGNAKQQRPLLIKPISSGTASKEMSSQSEHEPQSYSQKDLNSNLSGVWKHSSQSASDGDSPYDT